MENHNLKPLKWIGSSLKDITEMPNEVKQVFGAALHLARSGEKHIDAKPMRGFAGASVLEVVADDNSNRTYRCIYTVRFPGVICALHVFNKKSTQGIKTSRADIDMIKHRLSVAEQMYGASSGGLPR